MRTYFTQDDGSRIELWWKALQDADDAARKAAVVGLLGTLSPLLMLSSGARSKAARTDGDSQRPTPPNHAQHVLKSLVRFDTGSVLRHVGAAYCASCAADHAA